MKISLCMIVKDEEAQILPCLERALSVVDEAIIIDTGSTDKTRQVITDAYGEDPRVKVRDYVWENDFSKARNESLKYATGEWVLVLDADERVFADRKRIESQIETNDARAYIVMIYNILDTDNMIKTPTMVRLFKREGASYAGAIHEQVCYEGKTSDSVLLDEDLCRIYHYGYTLQIFNQKGKQIRNTDIIKEEIEKEPENPFHWYNMGVMEMTQGAYEEAIDAFLQSHRLCKDVRYTFHEDLILRIAVCMLQLKQYKQLINYVDTVTDDIILGRKPDLYYYQGLAYGELKKYARAVNSLRKAVSIGEYTKSASKYGSGSFLPMLKWAELLDEQDMVDEAAERYWDAVFDERNIQNAGVDMFRAFLERRGRSQDLERLTEKLSSRDKKDAKPEQEESLEEYKRQVKAAIGSLIEANDTVNAQKIIEEYEKIVPLDAEVYSLKGILAIVVGDLQQAEACFKNGLDCDGKNYDLLYNLGYLYQNTHRLNEAKALYLKALGFAQTDADRVLLEDLIRKL